VIASVSGRVAAREAELVVVEVGGVGLEVLPTRAAASAAQPGTVVTLATHLHVRDDGLTLYGFAGADERRLFRLLLGVTGVGPKLALAIVSAYPPAQLERAVAAGDVNLLASVVGVGKKTAQRICVDLRDRVAVGSAAVASGGNGAAAAATGVPSGASLDDPFYAAREALVGLGFPVAAAEAALEGVEGTVEARIKTGLTRLSGGARS
jgi:holliday junction DNA helicase RuvA